MFGSSKNVAPEEPSVMGLQTQTVATNQNARVLPWFAGTRWMSGTWIGDVFNVSTQPIKRKVGKKEQTTGYFYYSSFACLICNGIVDQITTIRFDDAIVWKGQIVRKEEDYVDITIPTRGVLRLYWGTETQTLDPDLSGSGQEHAPYRGQCYIVGKSILLGADKTTLPNIVVEVSRYPKPSWLPDSRIYQVGETVRYDVNPVAVLWDFWTDPRFGAGLDESELDIPRLAAAAAQILLERIGVSPYIDTQAEIKSHLVELFGYVDGYPTTFGGLLGMGLVRDGNSGPVLGYDDFTDDPDLDSQAWPDTYNEIRVKYPNGSKQGLDDSADHRELANFSITKRMRTQDLDRSWATNDTVARKLASTIGRVEALPQTSGTIMARESSVRNITVGSVFRVATRDGQLIQLRVSERAEPDPAGGPVELTCEQDRGWANQEFFAPAVPALPTDQTFAPSQLLADVQDAPYALAIAGETVPTMLFFAGRGDSYTNQFDVWRADSVSGNYVSASEQQSGNQFNRFSVRAHLTTQYVGDASTPLIDKFVGIAFDLDTADAALLEGEWDQDDALNHTLLAFVGTNGLEIMSLFDVAKVGATSYTAKTVRALYDTYRTTHNIGTLLWIQLRTNLVQMAWKPYLSSTRYYKFQPRFVFGTIELQDITAIAHADTARSLLPLAPVNLKSNGDGARPTWSAGGLSYLLITWTDGSKARTAFGQPLGETGPPDATATKLEIRSYDGATLKFTTTVTTTETTQLLKSDLNSNAVLDFTLRAYAVRGTFQSKDYAELKIRKV